MKHDIENPDKSESTKVSDEAAAERFRATARRIATAIDIEAAMWQMLDRDVEPGTRNDEP